jgi:hypothetical protein
MGGFAARAADHHLPAFWRGAPVKTQTVVIVSAAILLFSAAAANAQAPADQQSLTTEATFKSLDRNRDQALSKVEAKADNSISAVFDRADVNLDGYISKVEYNAYVQRFGAPTRDHAPPTPSDE